MSPDQLHQLDPDSGIPVEPRTGRSGAGPVQTVALTAAGRPVGILAVRARRLPQRTGPCSAPSPIMPPWPWNEPSCGNRRSGPSCWRRSTDLRRALLGAVSHDLRTPLASMKVASSTLLDRHPALRRRTDELHGLIDMETDRLTRLVTSLLDMTRFHAGCSRSGRAPQSVLDLVDEAVAALRPVARGAPVGLALPAGCRSRRRPASHRPGNRQPARKCRPSLASGQSDDRRRRRSAATGSPSRSPTRAGGAIQGTRDRLRQVRALRHRRALRPRDSPSPRPSSRRTASASGSRTRPAAGARFVFTLPLSRPTAPGGRRWPRSWSSMTTRRSCGPPASGCGRRPRGDHGGQW